MGQLSRRLADREGQVAHLRQQLQEVRASCGGQAGRLSGQQCQLVHCSLLVDEDLPG
jgi:hypothetical protein